MFCHSNSDPNKDCQGSNTQHPYKDGGTGGTCDRITLETEKPKRAGSQAGWGHQATGSERGEAQTILKNIEIIKEDS